MKGEKDDKDEKGQIGPYKVGKTLGIGSFGKVKLGTHMLTHKKVAIKKISYADKPRAKDSALKEAEILKVLHHKHVIRLYEVIDLEDKEELCIIMEFAEGGELFDYIVGRGRLKEDEARRIFAQIISALQYCHQSLIIHRDMKPENILLDSAKNVKLNDFGLSKKLDSNANSLYRVQTNCGSPLYTSPEIVRKQCYVGPEVDVWAAGVVLYAMVTGMHPWDGSTMDEQVKQSAAGIFQFPHYVTPVDMKKRATIEEIRAHPWLHDEMAKVPDQPVVAPREVTCKDDVDNAILTQLEKIGFNQQDIINDLINKEKTKPTYGLYFLALEAQERLRRPIRTPSPPDDRKNSFLMEAKQVAQLRDHVKQQKRHSWQPDQSQLEALRKQVNDKKTKDDSESHKKKDNSTPSGMKLKSLIGRLKKKSASSESLPTADTPDGKLIHVVSGFFSVDTTSTKAVYEIEKEIDKVLKELDPAKKWKVTKKNYLYKIKFKDVTFEMEICQIDKLDFLRGIRFARVGGPIWAYKGAVDLLKGSLKL